jgi:trehalose 6-phosphate phosphatase
LSQPLAEGADSIVARLSEAGHVLLALDFDGTLALLAPRPEDAVLPAATADVLRRLAAMQGVELAIVSGRQLEDVRARTGLDAIYAGNHGLEIEGHGIRFRHAQADSLRGAIDQACGALEERFQSVPGVRVEPKGLTATLHYRQAPRELETWIQATVRHAMRPYQACLGVRRGRKAWEIRPRVEWNKGSALRYLAGQPGVAGAAVLSAGDDLTDEDMFTAVPEAVSIRVGRVAHTAARFQAAGPPEFAAFLGRLESALAEARAKPCPELRCLPAEGGRPSA